VFHFSTILIDVQLLRAIWLEVLIEKSMELYWKNWLIFGMQNAQKLLERRKCCSVSEFDFEFGIAFQEINNVLSEWSIEMRVEIVP
jgi:hypothetical protein